MVIVYLPILIFAADVYAPKNRTRDRYVDIHHIKIDVAVDIEAGSVFGSVTHTLSPMSASLNEFTLDADDMTIRRIRMDDKDIDFVHSNGKLNISLGKDIGWEDTIKVHIDYTAFPRLGTFFVRPDEFYPEKPIQAWTQGEDEDNHHWVPLYDYPNDRSTFEVILTVNNDLKAISNGELVSLKKNNDGTSTWHWRENFPMVSYLISYVVGDYVKIEDSYKNIPVNYWVYHENKDEAMRSFGLTTDMMEYFGKVSGIEYPYEKYDQVILDDFMFGGMENITLTHNTDRTMHDEYASPDISSVGLVAHELAHQWYGDMLTTRNWANIWLNEGFATYLSRKYREHKFGYEEGEYIRYGEILSFFSSDKRWHRSTVTHNYYEPIDLFDGHVYAKGSLILTMMCEYLGESSFWKSIQNYTADNKYKNVETADLKKAIEETSGENLDWFFDQWLHRPGFPDFDVELSYNQRNRAVQLSVIQLQENLFKLPVEVRIDNDKHTLWVEKKDAVYEIKVSKRPKMVIFNTGMIVPCKMNVKKSNSDWIYQLQNAPHILDKIDAINVLKKKKGRRIVEKALLNTAKNDSFWGVRREAIKGFNALSSKQYESELMALGLNEDDSRVRRVIWNALKNYKGSREVSQYLMNVIETDSKYYSVSDAFKALVVVDSIGAGNLVESLLKANSHNDIIRKSAISYYGSVKSDKNYKKLIELVKYGGTTWDARPEAVLQLGKYVQDKPEVLKVLLDLFDDPSRDIRRNAIRSIGNYGNKDHFSELDIVMSQDPILGRDIRSAKRKIVARKKLSSSDIKTVDKIKIIKELDETSARLEKIKEILD